MNSSHSFRNQRLINRQREVTEQVIAFQLREEWFALPIFAVQRVLPLGDVYGDPSHSGICLTQYQGQEILVLDVAHLIFSELQASHEERISELSSPSSATRAEAGQRFLAVLQLDEDELMGLPIDSPPEVRRFPKSMIREIPQTYLEKGKIHCVSNMMLETDNNPPIFMLEPTQLIDGLD